MHTGSIDDFYSSLSFIPSSRLAVFMVHNGGHGGFFRSAMALPVIDRLLNLNYTPWSERYLKDFLKAEAAFKKNRDSLNALQVKNTSPSHALSEYAGNYSNAIYGTITIEHHDNQLFLVFRKQRAALHHFHYDQFLTKEEENGSPDFRLSFLAGNKGSIERISLQPFGEALAEFVRTPPSR
jgi:hypothetical protein